MKLQVVKGKTSKTVNLVIKDSSSTTGAGLSGLAFNTAGLTAYYVRERAAPVAITLVTQTVTGAYASGGFVEIDATNMPGWYRLDIPDAALATGSESVDIMLKGAANMAPSELEIELIEVDWQNDTTAGIKALPNFGPLNPGGLLTSGTGIAQLDLDAGGGIAKANVVEVDGETWKNAQITIALAVPTVAPQPVSGSNVFRLQWACTDGAGDPVSITPPLASNVTVVAVSETGIDRSGNVGTVVDDGSGVYHADYTVASTHPTEHVIFQIIATIASRARQSELSQTFVGRVQTNVRAWQDYVLVGPAMIESDGSGNSRYTVKALEQAPSGGGGGTDWSAAERDQIRDALGVDGDKTTATGGQLQTKSSHTAGDVWNVSAAEPTSRPAWSGMTYGLLFRWLGALNLNRRTQTVDTKTVRNDADTTNISTAPISDDGTTFDHGKFV